MKAEEFKQKVYEMREAEKAYWDIRENNLLKQVFDLETLIDNEIEQTNLYLKAHPDYKGSPDDKSFFDAVANYRKLSRKYFEMKKAGGYDKIAIGEIYKQVKSAEAFLDKALMVWHDTCLKNCGYRIIFHMMVKSKGDSAIKQLSSENKALIKAEIDDFNRHGKNGAIAFMQREEKLIENKKENEQEKEK